MKKKLVLSLDNNNYKENEKLILAGEWVLEMNKKKIENLNFKIFFSSSFLKEQRIKNTLDASKIYKSIFEDLYKILNNLHGVNFNLKAWKILLGHWLTRFIDLCFQKDFLIQEILNSNEIDKIYGIKNDEFILASEDTLSIHPNSRNILWLNTIFFKLFNFYKFKNIELDFKKVELSTDIQNLEKEYKSKVFYKIDFFKKLILKGFEILGKVKNKNDPLILSSGTPFFYEKFLQLLFFQVPQNYTTKKIKSNILDKKIRMKLFSKLNLNNDIQSLENFIRQILHEYLPMCFLENFKILYEECEKYYPKKPKFILTATEHDYNEIFKFYTAKRVNKGTPYFTLQHGNTYFTHIYPERCEYETSTKFLTFGHSKGTFFEPFGNIKTIGRKYKYNRKGKLNFLAMPMVGPFYPYDYNHEFLKSFELIRNFEKKLSSEIKEKTSLRLHPNFLTDRGNWFKKTYLKNFKKNQIDHGSIPYKKFLSQGRINLFFYDSTGILENFHYNIPTLAIWTDDSALCYNHIYNEFISKYDLLKEAGILFDDLNKLKNHIEKYWNNVDEWWLSRKTQRIIQEFNKGFNNQISFNSVFKLREIINKNI